MKEYNSSLSGFYNLSVKERLRVLKDMIDFNDEEIKTLENLGYFSVDEMDHLIENVVGSFQLPFGIATNFKINGLDYLIPMVIEEPSVIAAASKAAKIARKKGGFLCDKVKSTMIAQIQITNVKSLNYYDKLFENRMELIKIANETDPTLVRLGGGAFDAKIREIMTNKGPMLIIHLFVNVLDAMGANIVNTMAEAVSPYIEELCGGKVYLRIVTNLAIERLARAYAVFDKEMLGGEEVVNGIMNAYEFALADTFRAATHNKGIMNGISALALATGNDTRAIEAGAHGYAAIRKFYAPLTHFEINKNGDLKGDIELPLALGIIGGMTTSHPMVKIALKILRVESAEELSQIAAALGLAQNVAALRALVSEGIQKGHMKLHQRKVKKSN
ncbi:MAG: hydroxymethylglutaryl-CoA reductase, degradative [Promethearchaeota archaeon]